MKGYTLVELIFLLSLLSIMAKVISLEFNNNEMTLLDNTAQVLKDDIRYIQRLSMAENRKYKLEIASENNSRIPNVYIISYEDEENKTYVDIEAKRLPKGVFFSSTRPVAYTKNGTTSISSTIVISCGNQNKMLTVIPSSGRVEIKQ